MQPEVGSEELRVAVRSLQPDGRDREGTRQSLLPAADRLLREAHRRVACARRAELHREWHACPRECECATTRTACNKEIESGRRPRSPRATGRKSFAEADRAVRR